MTIDVEMRKYKNTKPVNTKVLPGTLMFLMGWWWFYVWPDLRKAPCYLCFTEWWWPCNTWGTYCLFHLHIAHVQSLFLCWPYICCIIYIVYVFSCVPHHPSHWSQMFQFKTAMPFFAASFLLTQMFPCFLLINVRSPLPVMKLLHLNRLRPAWQGIGVVLVTGSGLG